MSLFSLPACDLHRLQDAVRQIWQWQKQHMSLLSLPACTLRRLQDADLAMMPEQAMWEGLTLQRSIAAGSSTGVTWRAATSAYHSACRGSVSRTAFPASMLARVLSTSAASECATLFVASICSAR